MTASTSRIRDVSREEGLVSPTRAWCVIGATASVSMVVGFTIGALGPSLPELHARLHAPLDQLGILFGASFAGSLLATLALGSALDRHPPRPLMIGGVAIMALGLALLPLATTLLDAVALLGLAGLGSGTNSIGSAVLTTRLFGRHGGRALSLINMSFGLGAFTGPLIAAAVLDAIHDYRPLFAGISMVLIVPLLLYAASPLPAPPKPAHTRTRAALRSAGRAVPVLAVLTFLYLGSEVGFAGWAFTYVRQTTSADVTLASWAPAGFWLALSLSSLGSAVRPRPWRAERVVLVCGIGAFISALSFLVARGAAPLEVVAAAAVGLFLGPIYPLSLATAAGLVPSAAGRVSSLVIASSQLGGSILPWLQGLLLSLGPGWGVALTLVACAGMAGLQLVFLVIRGEAHEMGDS